MQCGRRANEIEMSTNVKKNEEKLEKKETSGYTCSLKLSYTFEVWVGKSILDSQFNCCSTCACVWLCVCAYVDFSIPRRLTCTLHTDNTGYNIKSIRGRQLSKSFRKKNILIIWHAWKCYLIKIILDQLTICIKDTGKKWIY